MKKIALLVGARPNYMKIAPIWRVINKEPESFSTVMIHTGQHYDREMSEVFFTDLLMAQPDVMLDVGSGSHAQQTGKAIIELEPVLMGIDPDVLVVAGDVNSTLAGTLVAVKMGIPVAHVEAGLRSFDRTMPEEINRVLVDSVADILFASCRDAVENLRKEGVRSEKIHLVGNVMIDSLVRVVPMLRTSDILRESHLEPGKYVCVTIHRPSNVDDVNVLKEILAGLNKVSRDIPVIFPVHPRTRKKIKETEWKSDVDQFTVTDPMGYIDFMQLMSNAAVVVTDSGGIQEETTYMGIPCLTIRDNTERPVTVSQGTNRLIKANAEDIVREVQGALGR
ncbi:MAG: UDP-N-acetylglucosamine 2-epimerase, partial [Lentisphaerae bacterium RIFOXYA12_FULL_48_11]